ncbi:class II glutamine amidotransferase [Clostridium botulinum]|nr:class II glutamine amidotransferase [Clostridium botulinum]
MKYFSAIGHVRYSTSGNASIENAQPFQEETIDGSISLAHNGNLLNYLNIKYELEKKERYLKVIQTLNYTKVYIRKIQEVREIEKP